MENPDRPGHHPCPHTTATPPEQTIHKHKHTQNVNRWIQANFERATPARMLCAALTDAVGDHRTQNQPGTIDEYPNWRVPLSGPDGAPMSLDGVFHSQRALRLSAVMNGFVVPPTAHRSTSDFIIGLG